MSSTDARVAIGLIIGTIVAISCASSHPAPDEVAAPPDPIDSALARLREFDESRRKSTDFAHLPTSDTLSGPDPFAIALLPGAGPPLYVALLRGRDAVVLIDAQLREIERIAGPPAPTGLAINDRGDIFVSSEISGRIDRLRRQGDHLEHTGRIDLDGVFGARAIAVGSEGVLYLTDERNGRLVTLEIADAASAIRLKRRSELHVGEGAFRVVRAGHYVLVDCLLDHVIVIYRVDGEGRPIPESEARIHHDGPIWSLDAKPAPRISASAAAEGEDLVIALGGVEDHPLDRTGGSFGYIDSFAYVYRMSDGASPRRVAEVNTSALGVITPKWIALDFSGDSKLDRKTEIRVSGYGGDHMVVLGWSGDPAGEPSFAHAEALPPGTTSAAPLPDGALVFSDPLLDGWIRRDAAGAITIVPVEDGRSSNGDASDGPPPRFAPESRVGEALFFTTLMAPWDKSDGELSRFTCETCHFEGYVDGRTHHTGRADVHATTKPLLGLGNNRPHFSRALDPDLTAVAHNEFRVAGARSDHDPWFSVELADYPWLSSVGVREASISAEELRRSLLGFLFEFTHKPNPVVLARLVQANEHHEAPAFTSLERDGATAFRDRCERCHAARLMSDVPGSRVPFDAWESLVFAREGAIVWGRAGYEKTGVVPYVNEEGARVPSLRRLAKKRPYFTNGAAEDLASVLDRVRFGEGAFLHDRGQADPSLDALGEHDRAAILAFLDLL